MPLNYKIIKVDIGDNFRWNELLSSSINGSYRASMEYEYSKVFLGRETQSFIFNHNGEDLAGVHYSAKQIANGIIRTADILSGIIFKHTPDNDLVEYILNHFLEWAKDEKVSLVSYSPWLPARVENKDSLFLNTIEYTLKKTGFSQFTKGRSTYWIDLSLSDEQLLNNMKRQTRYEINKALKSGIIFTKYEKPTEELINQFWLNYSQIGKSKGFNTLNENKFKHEIFTFLDTGLADLFVACFENTPINYSLVSKVGVASYLHGAINQNFKQIRNCPSPGQISQWEMIKSSKTLGLKTYDLGFCPGPIPIPEHKAYNIWKFKYGFGGMYVEFLPVFGKVLHPIAGNLIKYYKYKQ